VSDGANGNDAPLQILRILWHSVICSTSMSFLALRTPMRSIGYGAKRAGEGDSP
jgi:energy-coupling factor transporter transmembrane protein EcfT